MRKMEVSDVILKSEIAKFLDYRHLPLVELSIMVDALSCWLKERLKWSSTGGEKGSIRIFWTVF